MDPKCRLISTIICDYALIIKGGLILFSTRQICLRKQRKKQLDWLTTNTDVITTQSCIVTCGLSKGNGKTEFTGYLWILYCHTKCFIYRIFDHRWDDKMYYICDILHASKNHWQNLNLFSSACLVIKGHSSKLGLRLEKNADLIKTGIKAEKIPDLLKTKPGLEFKKFGLQI